MMNPYCTHPCGFPYPGSFSSLMISSLLLSLETSDHIFSIFFDFLLIHQHHHFTHGFDPYHPHQTLHLIGNPRLRPLGHTEHNPTTHRRTPSPETTTPFPSFRLSAFSALSALSAIFRFFENIGHLSLL